MNWNRRNYGALLIAIGTLTGCGHSEEEWKQQLDKYGKLDGKYQDEKKAHAEAQADLDKRKAQIAELRKRLDKMGVNLDKLSGELEQGATEKEQLAKSVQEMQSALEEYKKRAEQLERIRARFEALQAKLKKLVTLGLKVEIRHNRMVIRLPGDVLFASGSDKLTPEGEKVVLEVADVIRGDQQLNSRYFQIAGHTDAAPLKGGKFGDNWGLSAMRARSVLLTLVTPQDEKGGGLNPTHLHAAGYGETDPVETNDSKEGKQANRRVELVLLPNVEEMLDLKSML
jgi:chemotaxis protein MotB